MKSEDSPITTEEVRRRVPKRVLHFSDGTLEEYSSDEDEIQKEHVNESQVSNVNPATLSWMPWILYQTTFAGGKALAACDYLGEYFANFFGILSPKYAYEIEQYKKMKAEEAKSAESDPELGWTQSGSPLVVLSQSQPSTTTNI